MGGKSINEAGKDVESRETAVEMPVRSESYRAMVWRLFRENRKALGGLYLLVALYALAVFAPFVADSKPFFFYSRPADLINAETGAAIEPPPEKDVAGVIPERSPTRRRELCFPLFRAFLIPSRLVDLAFNAMAVFWVVFLAWLAFRRAALWMKKKGGPKSRGGLRAPLYAALSAVGIFLILAHEMRFPSDPSFRPDPRDVPLDRFLNTALLFGAWMLLYLPAAVFRSVAEKFRFRPGLVERLEKWTPFRHAVAGTTGLAALLLVSLFLHGKEYSRENLDKISFLTDLFSWSFNVAVLWPALSAVTRLWRRFAPERLIFSLPGALSRVALPAAALLTGSLMQFMGLYFHVETLFDVNRRVRLDPRDYYTEYIHQTESPDWRVSAFFPPVHYDPFSQHTAEKLQPPAITASAGKALPRSIPGDRRIHWMGTDDTGRDVAARMIHGTRISLSVGFVAVGIAVVIGLFFGSLAGYFGGWMDIIVSRFIELIICIPGFFLMLTIIAVTRPSLFNIMFIIGIIGWTGIARLVRGEFLRLRNLDFVTAARALGFSDSHVIFRHILPNALGPVFVSVSFGVAGAILSESGLSFLGIGVPPPTPTWGEALRQGLNYVTDDKWWLVIYPGAAIFLTVLAFNLVGDGLRDAMDPRLKR